MFDFLTRKLVVNFGKINTEKSSELIGNKVELSLYVADKFLKKMSVRLDPQDKKRAIFEIISEGFLYFLIGARDALLQEINDKLRLGIDIEDVKLMTIMHRLQNLQTTNTNVWKVFELLHNCTMPITIPLLIDRSKTWLWEINYLRNQIGHRSIISKSVAVMIGSASTPRVSMIIYGDIRENDPIRYFKDCYEKFIKLKEDVRKLL